MSNTVTKLVSFPGTFGAAIAVLSDCYGKGEERKKSLEADGYDYQEVQSCVNELCEIMEKFSNG